MKNRKLTPAEETIDVFKLSKVDLAVLISGENILEQITLSTLCIECVDDPPKEPYGDLRAYYIFQGNGLCKRHFDKARLATPEKKA